MGHLYLVSKAQVGEELSQLARLLFDSAARKWYSAVVLEIGAGVLAAILSVLDYSGDSALTGAAIVTVMLAASYFLRLWFDVQYETSETMRRQSVLSEALGWPVEAVQMSEWRDRAGKRIRTRQKAQPRSSDYYATSKSFGPERLAEMTVESAFYTRHLYKRLKVRIWGIFIGALVLTILITTMALTKTIPTSIDLVVARVVYTLIPLVLSVNLLGWALRLERLVSDIRVVEQILRGTLDANPTGLPQVLRLVSEYNCQVVAGFPILNWLYKRWMDDIDELWRQSQ